MSFFPPRLLLFAISTGLLLHGTTIIAITTESAAYIGTDSQTRQALGTKGSICKLITSRVALVGMSGHLGDSATAFSAGKLISDALERSAGLTAAVENVIAAVEGPLADSLHWGHLNAREEYMKAYDGKLALALLIVGINGSRPEIVYVGWRAEDGSARREPRKSLGVNQFNAIGAYGAFLKYLSANPGWTQAAPEKRIRTALEIEVRDEPDTVGAPFSIARITKSGYEWIENGVCK